MRTRSGERGAALILFTFLTFFVIVPVVGLSIDGSIMMWQRSRLSAATDAAALAAGRSLSIGSDLTAQEDSARRTALAYFNTNFQPGSMGTSIVGGAPSVTFQQTSLRVRKVQISVSALVPMTFSRMFGQNNGSISAFAESSRRDVNIIMVMDRSGSMSSVCSTVKSSAQQFLTYFVNGRDDIGLVSFSTNATVDYYPSVYFQQANGPNNVSMKDAIGRISCSGTTNMAMALGIALQQLRSTNRPGALNVILFYTDGEPNAFEAIFPVKSLSDERYEVQISSQGKYTFSNLNTVSGDKKCKSNLRGTVTGGVDTATGATTGVYDSSVTTMSGSANPPLLNASGCEFSDKNDANLFRDSVAYIPDTDAYGSSSTGYKPGTGPLDYFPTSNSAYGGVGMTIRPDSPRNILNVAYNTADNAGSAIRNDPDYQPIIYTIGYSSGVDSVLMKRLVNDSTSANYNRSKATGRYIQAPTADQLSTAFQQIASQILSISR